MRYQERIYIQNENKAVRNKDILNVNTSSDICIFETPIFSISGASKLDCSTGSTSGTSYIITGSTDTIPLTFDFTANTSSFTANSATFKFEIYKYSNLINEFLSTAVYKSNQIEYSAFSATNSTTQLIPTDQLNLDGEYIIKPFYQFGVCTDFMSRLNKKVDTSIFINGSMYGIYNDETDYYFIAINQAEIPQLINNSSNSLPSNQLVQNVLQVVSGQTTFIISNFVGGDFIFTLNGLVLAKDLDYSLSGQVVTLFEECVYDDIVTIIYTTSSVNNFVGDNYEITGPIASGATDGQGNNSTYYNTTTGKYEVYTSLPPSVGNQILMMLNGVTLAIGIDYYQSTSNTKRIILSGDLVIGDIITLVYFPVTGVINGLNTNQPVVTWFVTNPPTQKNGYFSLEVSYDDIFSSYYYSGKTDYIVGSTYYNDSFTATGDVGTNLYYRVKNNKDYVTICGDIVNSVTYSDIIPVTIQTNSINTY
jgi:hypothetical protein